MQRFAHPAAARSPQLGGLQVVGGDGAEAPDGAVDGIPAGAVGHDRPVVGGVGGEAGAVAQIVAHICQIGRRIACAQIELVACGRAAAALPGELGVGHYAGGEVRGAGSVRGKGQLGDADVVQEHVVTIGADGAEDHIVVSCGAEGKVETVVFPAGKTLHRIKLSRPVDGSQQDWAAAQARAAVQIDLDLICRSA